MYSKAWLATPVLLAHAEVTKKHNIFSMGPKLRYPAGTISDNRSRSNSAAVGSPDANFCRPTVNAEALHIHYQTGHAIIQ